MPLSKTKRQAAYDQVAAAIAENKARKAAYAQRAASTFGVSEVGKNGRLTIKQKPSPVGARRQSSKVFSEAMKQSVGAFYGMRAKIEYLKGDFIGAMTDLETAVYADLTKSEALPTPPLCR